MELKEIVTFVKEGKRRFTIGESNSLLVTDNCEKPASTRRKRLVCVGFETLRKGLKFFNQNGCFYSLRNGPGSVCVIKKENREIEVVYCGQIGHDQVFYIQEK
jgi:hypothetical protein